MAVDYGKPRTSAYLFRRLLAIGLLSVLVLTAIIFVVPGLRHSDWYMLPADRSVEGSWGASSDEMALEEGRERISFADDGTFHAYNGSDCNRISGRWSQRSDGILDVEPKMMTLESCRMDRSSDAWFSDWTYMRVSDRGHQLIVYGEDSQELGRLWRA